MNEFLKLQLDYLYWLQNIREATGHYFDGFFSFITTCAEHIIVLLIITFLYWVFNKKYGIFVVLSLCTSVFFNSLFKIIAYIYRPWILDARIKPVPTAMNTATGYSFPSGHTAKAMATYGSLARLLKSKKIICWSLILLILIIGFSRNYLGVHTPQDVIVSLVVGLFIILGIEKLLVWVDKKLNNDLIAYFCYVGAIILLILYANFKSYPLDYINGEPIVDPKKTILDIYPQTGLILGLATGWIADRKFINYQISGSFISKLIEYIIGNGLLILAFIFLKPLFINILHYRLGDFSFNFIIGAYITGIFPFFVQYFSKQHNK